MSTMTPLPPRFGTPERDIPKHYVARGRLAAIVTHVCVLIGVFLSIFPFYWLFVMSTQTTAEIFGYPPKLLPGTSFAENVRNVITSVDLLGSLWNTIIVAVLSAVLVMF